MFGEAREAIGPLGVFVANARPDVEHFYRPALDLTPEHWRSAMDSQATALLLSAREAAATMVEKGGRIVAVTLRQVDGLEAGDPGQLWDQRRRLWNPCCDISPGNLLDAVSPSTR